MRNRQRAMTVWRCLAGKMWNFKAKTSRPLKAKAVVNNTKTLREKNICKNLCKGAILWDLQKIIVYLIPKGKTTYFIVHIYV